MSAILGVFGRSVPQDDAGARALMAPMAQRGADLVDIWRDGGAVLAVSRYHWESGTAFSGGAGVVEEGSLVVAADASLYYRDDLRRALVAAGVEAGPTASHLILAAWRAWGADGLARLEGDFAFVLYDRSTRNVACARDFGGRRPLYFADLADTLVVASTVGGVRAHPGVPADVNLAVIAAMASALLDEAVETSFSAVQRLKAGWLLTNDRARTAMTRFWTPPAVDADGATSFDEAAEELRELLVQAVAERTDADGATSVLLSGGWDSPAVFAAGEEFFRRRGRGETLRPVSISYPEGDSGREDELIQSMLDWTHRTTRWIDIADIPFIVAPQAEAAARDEPYGHTFEHWLRALARGSRAEGARVALDGDGGDLLFAATRIYLADLVRTGRLNEFRREWRATGLSQAGPAALFPLVARPLLRLWAGRVAERIRPAAPGGSVDVSLPDWIDRGFARRHKLLEHARSNAPAPSARTLADMGFQVQLMHPLRLRIVPSAASLLLEEGVESRGPLFDARLVRFAARRPRVERTSGPETKRLLRRACEPWLPPEFLAVRRRRTGTTGSYARAALRETHAAFIGEVLGAPVLGQLGIVRPEILAARWNEYLSGVTRHGFQLYTTFQTELWVRAHMGHLTSSSGGKRPSTAQYA
jgi:asparagine synthase (glutamine-hydrolysing)